MSETTNKRKERLAKALRENLHRRKAQLRARSNSNNGRISGNPKNAETMAATSKEQKAVGNAGERSHDG